MALVETLERLEVDRCLLSHDDEPLERDAYQEWLRVMKQAGQLVQQVPRNAPSLEDAVARKLGRLLTEEEAEIMGYFAAGIQHGRDD